MAAEAEVAEAPGCGPGVSGFNPRQSPLANSLTMGRYPVLYPHALQRSGPSA